MTLEEHPMQKQVLLGAAAAIGAGLLSALVTARIVGGDLKRCVVDEGLAPVGALLADDQRIVESLVKDGLADSEGTLLESYLARIRKDGVTKYSAMRQRIDSLVDNNTTIVAVLSKYSPRARTPEFKTASDKFRDYAASFRDRWHSTFEIFMAGGNLPAAGPERPAQFDAALSAEIAAH